MGRRMYIGQSRSLTQSRFKRFAIVPGHCEARLTCESLTLNETFGEANTLRASGFARAASPYRSRWSVKRPAARALSRRRALTS
jgi:hypothetical protein